MVGDDGSILNLEVFIVRRLTPRGAWIVPEWAASWPEKQYERFVLCESYRRHAYPDKLTAIRSYIRRKRRHIAILQNQLKIANDGLNAANEIVKKTAP